MHLYPLHIASPYLKEAHKAGVAHHNAGRVFTGMERYPLCVFEVSIKKVFYTVAVVKEFLRVHTFLYPAEITRTVRIQDCGMLHQIHIVNKSECAHGTGRYAYASVHTFRTGKTEFALLYDMLQTVNVQILVALKTGHIVAVALVVAEKQVLAVG